MLDAISLDWLHARVVEDEDGCLIWQGCITKSGQPQAGASGGRGYVRRWIWSLVKDKPLSKELWTGVKCEKHGCVHPDHIVARPRSVAMRGRVRGPVERHRIAVTKRASSKVPEEVIEKIRNSTGSCREIGEQLGLRGAYVSAVRTGRIRKQYGGHFVGLGAR